MSDDALDWTALQALDAAREEAWAQDPDACVVLFLWREGGVYDTRFLQSGLSMSEMVALLEIQKQRIIQEQMMRRRPPEAPGEGEAWKGE